MNLDYYFGVLFQFLCSYRIVSQLAHDVLCFLGFGIVIPWVVLLIDECRRRLFVRIGGKPVLHCNSG